MIRAHLESVLLYADGVQLAVLRDAVASSYIAVLAERTAGGDKYLCTKISPHRLGELRRGEIDLRVVFDDPELRTWFSATVADDLRHQLDLSDLGVVPRDWLPEAGFRLAIAAAESDAEARTVREKASEKNRTVIHLHLDPPEAQAETKIDAGRLSLALAAFQRVVDRALRVRSHEKRKDRKREPIDADESTLQVLGFGAGSFGVHLQSKALPDLFGGTLLSAALERIDGLVSKSDDPAAVVTAAREYRGHFVSAYQELLKFVFEGDTPLTYFWSDPQIPDTRRHAIAPEQAREVYAALIEREDLSQEVVVLLGTFNKVDSKSGAWRLRDTDGREHAGESKDGGGALLSGVIVDQAQYEVRCQEILTEVAGTGKQQARLVLLELHTAG